MNSNEIQQFLPRLKGLVDPKVELELTNSILRIYNFFEVKMQQQKFEFEKQLAAQMVVVKKSQEDVNGLVGIFAQPLAGSPNSDPLLQSFVNNFSVQIATFVFAGPIPSFRALVVADLPNAIPLSKLDTKIVKTDDAFTKTLGAPVTDGFITLKDNNGDSVKILTTA